MRPVSLLLAGLVAVVVAVSGVLGARTFAAGLVVEAEPNDSCAAAQNLGSLGGPIAVHGALPGTGSYPYPEPGAAQSPDYYAISAAPGTLVEVTLNSVLGRTPIASPLLGSFNQDGPTCSRTDFSESNRLISTVGSSGKLIVAVSSYDDYDFATGGFYGGTYELSLQAVQFAGSINGRIVDGPSGAPQPYRGVELHRCAEGSCQFAAYGTADSQGRFSFIHTVNAPYPPPGNPPYSDTPSYLYLLAGSYQVVVSDYSGQYQPLISPIFDVGSGATVNIGDLALQPIPQGRSISGRFVDAVTGKPLSGFSEPYVRGYLNACTDYGCYESVAYLQPDASGRFTISRESGYRLPAGPYQIVFGADEYQPGQTPIFTLAVDQALNLGTIKIQPNPIRLTRPVGCEPIPASGGICRYSLDVTSAQPRGATLKVWSIINSNNGAASSTFQPEPAQTLRLRYGETKTARFQVNVPKSLSPGSTFCADVLVANDGRDFAFNAQARAFVFCGYKSSDGRVRPLPPEQALRLLQNVRGLAGTQSIPPARGSRNLR